MAMPRQILTGSSRNVAAGAKLVGKTSGTANVHVTVVLKRKNEIPRDDLHRRMLMRPRERPHLIHSNFADQYGASEQAIDADQIHGCSA
jgi:hypothetical protein